MSYASLVCCVRSWCCAQLALKADFGSTVMSDIDISDVHDVHVLVGRQCLVAGDPTTDPCSSVHVPITQAELQCKHTSVVGVWYLSHTCTVKSSVSRPSLSLNACARAGFVAAMAVMRLPEEPFRAVHRAVGGHGSRGSLCVEVA